MKIGILGAGLSGLSLAYFLKKKDYELLEKEKEIGGLCRTHIQEGFTFDRSGGHIVFSKDKEIFGIMKNFIKGNAVKNKRNAKILFKGKYVKYPFENGLSYLPKPDNLECLYYFINNEYKSRNPKNLKEWVYSTFGKGIAEKYLIPYNEKIWKTKTENLSTEWVSRIPQPPVKDIIKSSLGIETEGYTHQLFFYYPAKGGIFFLIDSIKKNVKNIRPNFNIKKIKKHHGGWLVSDGDTTKKFDRIVSTIPLQELIKCLDDVPKAVREAADNLKYNSLVTLGICIGEKEKTNMSWLYMPQSDVLFHRLVYLNNYSKLTAPLGKSSLIAEFTYNEDSNIGKMSDAELKKHTIRALKDKLGIDTVTNIVVFRTEYAYVVYNLNYCKDLKIIKDYLHKLGIVLCGRFGEHKYMNMDECIKSAKTTAEEMNKYN